MFNSVTTWTPNYNLVCGLLCAGNALIVQVEVSNMGSNRAGLWLLNAIAHAWVEVMPSDPSYTGPRHGQVRQFSCVDDYGMQLDWPYAPSYMGYSGLQYADVALQYNLAPGRSMSCISNGTSLQYLPPGQVKFTTWVGRNTIQGTEYVEATLPVPRSPHLSFDLQVSRCMPSDEAGEL